MQLPVFTSRARPWLLPRYGPFSALAAGALVCVAAAQAPATVFLGESGIAFPPQDVAITPNGNLAVVRAAGPTTALTIPTTDELTVWRTSTGGRLTLTNCGQSLGRGAVTVGYASDALAITNDVAVAIGSAATLAGPDTMTQIDVVRLSGGSVRCGGSFSINVFLNGDHGGLPSDVAITPDSRQAVVNHRNWVSFLDLTFEPAQIVHFYSVGTYPGPQSDSVAVTNTRAIVSTTLDISGVPHTVVSVFDITTPGAPIQLTSTVVGGEEDETRPHDVAITPDGTMAVVTCNDRFVLFDLATGVGQESPVSANQDRQYGAPAFPVDSVELTDDRAVLIARDLASNSWVAEVWNLVLPLTLPVAQFYGQAGHEVHDLSVRVFGSAVFAAIRAGSPSMTYLEGREVILRGIEAGATPTAFTFGSAGSPFGSPATLFCSDSIDIAGVGIGGSPPTVYAMSLGSFLYPPTGKLVGYARAINLRTLPPTAVQVFPVQATGNDEGVPVDLALAHHGEDVLVRSFAPPSEANPGAGGYDLMRLHVLGLPGQDVELAGLIGGAGDSGTLRLFACDSVASGGDYTVSISELTTGLNKGRVHFVQNAP